MFEFLGVCGFWASKIEWIVEVIVQIIQFPTHG
jgi:hypothetical protein